MMNARPYANKLNSVIGSLAQRAVSDAHPLLAQRGTRNVEFVVLTSDRGLCGSYNTNVLKKTVALFKEKKDTEKCDISLNVIGKKGRDFLKRREYVLRKDWTGISGNLTYSHASTIAQEIIENYAGGDADEVYLIYNQFKSALTQDVVATKILPIEPDETSGEAADFYGDYMYEPSAEVVLDKLLPKHVEFQVYRAMLESEASELGSRMTAMDAASTNAGEMIKKLTLVYNKARQASITKELMEIISGAEALN
jgi:F-type H+-transporting ATPase subunit gamma